MSDATANTMTVVELPDGRTRYVVDEHAGEPTMGDLIPAPGVVVTVTFERHVSRIEVDAGVTFHDAVAATLSVFALSKT